MIPAGLLKRLQKRGIINKEDDLSDSNSRRPRSPDVPEKKSKNDSTTELNKEEIIAEDYDEYDLVNPEAYEYTMKKKPTAGSGWSEQMKRRMTARFGYQSVEGCQNKYNVYHKCTLYCVTRYGEVEFEIEKEYDKRHKRLLQRYPLPNKWKKVYDIGCKSFYYYNKETHVVSWLPPTHPDAKVGKSAKALRKELMDQLIEPDYCEESTPVAVIVESYPPLQKVDQIKDLHPLMPETIKPPVVLPPKRPPHKKLKPRDSDRSYSKGEKYNRDSGNSKESRRSKQLQGSLDPMDPAAYSDIPRGTWSAGLNTEDRKSGVDSTATGPLFQMRPYPSPGAVLKANAANSKKGKSDSDDDDNVKVSVIKEYNNEEMEQEEESD